MNQVYVLVQRYIPFNIYIEYLRFIEKEDQCQGNQMHFKYNYEQVLGMRHF